MRMTADGFRAAARLLAPGLPGGDREALALLRAVIEIEARGSGFDKQGRVLILYEPHVAWRVLGRIIESKAHSQAARSQAIADRREMQASGLAYPKWGERPYPRDSYPNFLKAARINPEAAAQACSWGLGQILGENHKAAGYDSATKMASAFATGEDEQLAGMVRFIRANPTMHRSLLARDWAGFASRYNGPGYKKHNYHSRLAAAYAKAFRAGEKAILPKVAVGATLNDQKRIEAQRAIVAGAAAPATVATATVAVPPKPQAPETPISDWAGVALGLALAGALVAGGFSLWKRSRPVERAPVIEEPAT